MSLKCPNDGATLVMSEQAGAQIDYCPECRGVWLERGVLDRIVEHSSSREDRNDDHDRRDDHREHRHDDHHRHDDEHDDGREPRGRKHNRLSDIAGMFGGGSED